MTQPQQPPSQGGDEYDELRTLLTIQQQLEIMRGESSDIITLQKNALAHLQAIEERLERVEGKLRSVTTKEQLRQVAGVVNQIHNNVRPIRTLTGHSPEESRIKRWLREWVPKLRNLGMVLLWCIGIGIAILILYLR